MRSAIAWTLYWLGDLVFRVFDQWLRVGLVGPLHRVYNTLMCWSDDVQGDGPGPWSPNTR